MMENISLRCCSQVTIDTDRRRVNVDPGHGRAQVTVAIKDLSKHFDMGDHVKILDGRRKCPYVILLSIVLSQEHQLVILVLLLSWMARWRLSSLITSLEK